MSDVITALTKITKPIYGAQLVYPQAAAIEKGIDAKELKKLRGDMIEIGEPQSWNLVGLCNQKGTSLPPDIMMMLSEFDFWLVEFACSFLPAPDHQISWARFMAKLGPIGNQPSPIAYDLYPKEIADEIRTKCRIRLGLDLKFLEVAQVQLPDYIREIEFTKLEPTISAAGLLTSTPSWDFRKTKGGDVRGVKALFVIIKNPLVAQDGIKVSFAIQASVDTRFGLLPCSAKRTVFGSQDQVICSKV